jgi:hypothetical protein
MNWIKVTDALPEPDTSCVLILDKDDDISIACYRSREKTYQKNYKKVKEIVYEWEYIQDEPYRPQPVYWCALENIPRPYRFEDDKDDTFPYDY